MSTIAAKSPTEAYRLAGIIPAIVLLGRDRPDKNRKTQLVYIFYQGVFSWLRSFLVTRRDDLTGRRFGKLVVLQAHHTDRKGILYWSSLCDCGNTHIANGWNMKNGHTTSCGCFADQRMATEIRGLRKVIRNYINNAEIRGYKWLLTEEEAAKLIHEPCHYCGRSDTQYMDVSSKKNPGLLFTYTGIDRVDNLEGYTKRNVVPCCTICNRAKQGMSYKEFISYLDSICSLRSQNGKKFT